MAVLPSAESATDDPCSAPPFALATAPVPTSFGPCCVNCASASCDEKSSAAKIRRTDAPPKFGQACPVPTRMISPPTPPI